MKPFSSNDIMWMDEKMQELLKTYLLSIEELFEIIVQHSESL